MKFLYICLIAIFICFRCKGATTQQLLDADFLATDQTRIDLLSPKDGAPVDQNPVFAWTLKPGIALYSLEISSKTDFSGIVLRKEISGGSYSLTNGDLINLLAMDATEYFWRVKAAKIKTDLQSATFGFQVLSRSVIYVDVNSTASSQVGNKSAPLKTIQGALELADSLRNSDTSKAQQIYVSAGTYSESITLKPAISLYGGYSSTGGWSRNTTANLTTIQAPGDRAIQGLSNVTAGFTSTTIVDGFTITGGNVANSTNMAIYLINASPTINNNTINGGAGTNSYAISMNSAAPTISNNTINGGSGSAGSHGLYNNTSSPAVTNNTINGGTGGSTVAISNANSSNPTVSNNTLNGGGGTGNSHAMQNDASSPTVTNNTMNGGTGGQSYAIYSANASAPTVSGNTLHGGKGSGSSTGIYNDASAPTFTGNTIDGGDAPGSVYGIFNENASPILKENTIFAGRSTNSTIGIYNTSSSAPTISDNSFHGGYAEINSYAILNTSNSSAIITGNIIHGGCGATSYALKNEFSSSPVVSNNFLISGCGALSYSVDLSGSSRPRFTNNIMILNGQNRYGLNEADTTSDPRSFENNAFWDMHSGGGLNYYRNENATTISTIASIESLTDWNGGSDKGRGNFLLPAGATGNPFINVPAFFDRVSVANTGSATILKIADGRCAGSPAYTNGQYIEWNGDGIARQITCNAATNPDEITITPALSSAATNLAGAEIRYWGVKSSGGSQYSIDYHLQQNSLTLQQWNNIRYGGKNTSGNNCGAPGGGPGAGAGGESCGGVTADKDNITRTTLNAGLANNSDCAAAGGVADPQPCDNSPAGETPAIPGGFSIGVYESD